MIRPGRRLVGLLGVVCAAALLVPLRPQLVWLWLFSLAATLGAAALEVVRMRGVVLTLDRVSRLVFPLGEDDLVSLNRLSDLDGISP